MGAGVSGWAFECGSERVGVRVAHTVGGCVWVRECRSARVGEWVRRCVRVRECASGWVRE